VVKFQVFEYSYDLQQSSNTTFNNNRYLGQKSQSLVRKTHKIIHKVCQKDSQNNSQSLVRKIHKIIHKLCQKIETIYKADQDQSLRKTDLVEPSSDQLLTTITSRPQKLKEHAVQKELVIRSGKYLFCVEKHLTLHRNMTLFKRIFRVFQRSSQDVHDKAESTTPTFQVRRR